MPGHFLQLSDVFIPGHVFCTKDDWDMIMVPVEDLESGESSSGTTDPVCNLNQKHLMKNRITEKYIFF